MRSKLGTERSEVCLASSRPNANRKRTGTRETRTRSIFTQAPSVTAAHTCLPCHLPPQGGLFTTPRLRTKRAVKRAFSSGRRGTALAVDEVYYSKRKSEGDTSSVSLRLPPVSLRLGHTRALTPHCGVIHSPRAASLPTGEGFLIARFLRSLDICGWRL